MTSITVGFVLSALAIASILIGCSAGMKSAEAEATYLGQQLRCVDQAKTRDESEECRRKVRLAWGISETTRDAGADR